jgi:predicted transglutaminase-like protease
MAVKNIDVKIRYAYARFRRKLALYILLWFLALLAAVSLIIDSVFIPNAAYTLKIWSVVLVILIGLKLAYDASTKIKDEYSSFKQEYNQTDQSLKSL